MTNITIDNNITQVINGHKVTIGYEPYADQIIMKFPWIQIDDGPKYFVDTDGDHHGSIGIDNPQDFNGTILEKFISNVDMYGDESDTYYFDMGGMFCIVSDNGQWNLIDEDEYILTPLGMINNGDGMYGNG